MLDINGAHGYSIFNFLLVEICVENENFTKNNSKQIKLDQEENKDHIIVLDEAHCSRLVLQLNFLNHCIYTVQVYIVKKFHNTDMQSGIRNESPDSALHVCM